MWGAVAGSGGAAGVLLGGMLTEYAGWEWVLFVNVPIGHRRRRARAAAAAGVPHASGARHFDIAGAVTVTAGLSLLVYALVDANGAGWLSTQTLGLGAVALALLAAFVRDRAALDGAAGPVPDLPDAHADRRQRHRRCWSPRRCSRCSSSSRSTCSRCSATRALKAGLAYLPLAVGIIVVGRRWRRSS